MIVRRIRSAMRRHAAGADLSKLARLPRWIDALLSHDRVAYPLHAIAGELLNRLEAPVLGVVANGIKVRRGGKYGYGYYGGYYGAPGDQGETAQAAERT